MVAGALHERTGGVVSLIVTEAVAVFDSPALSVTVKETLHDTAQPGEVSTVSTGVSLVASLKLPPGQVVLHKKLNGPSRSRELEPSRFMVVKVWSIVRLTGRHFPKSGYSNEYGSKIHRRAR